MISLSKAQRTWFKINSCQLGINLSSLLFEIFGCIKELLTKHDERVFSHYKINVLCKMTGYENKENYQLKDRIF